MPHRYMLLTTLGGVSLFTELPLLAVASGQSDEWQTVAMCAAAAIPGAGLSMLLFHPPETDPEAWTIRRLVLKSFGSFFLSVIVSPYVLQLSGQPQGPINCMAFGGIVAAMGVAVLHWVLPVFQMWVVSQAEKRLKAVDKGSK